MHQANDPAFLKRLRTLQIICGALTLGVVNFLGILVFIKASQPGTPASPANGQPLGTYASFAFFVLSVPISFTLVRVIAQIAIAKMAREIKGLAETPSAEQVGEKLFVVRQSTLIVHFAMMEASAMFGGAMFITEKQWTAIFPMIGFIFFALGNFPSKSRVLAWLEKSERELGEAIQRES